MKNHLSINIGGDTLELPSDFSLSVEDENPLFGDPQSFSYPVKIPITGNRSLLGAINDKHSGSRIMAVEGTPADIHVDGFPFTTGKLVTSDDEEIGEEFSFSIDARTQTLKDMVSDLECRDIPVKDKIKLGEKIVSIQGSYSSNIMVYLNENTTSNIYIEYFDSAGAARSYNQGLRNGLLTIDSYTSVVNNLRFQALGFSCPYKFDDDITKNAPFGRQEATDSLDGWIQTYPDKSNAKECYINTDKPYTKVNGKPVSGTEYCNVAVSYKHYDLDDDKTTSSNIDNANPYMVLNADRMQSGVCFYVLYFLDCLFSHLGLEWDDSALYAIEDFRRLAFYTTTCSYTEEGAVTKRMSFEDINSWLKSRGCGTVLSKKMQNLKFSATKDINTWGGRVYLGDYFYTPGYKKVDAYYDPVTKTIRDRNTDKQILSVWHIYADETPKSRAGWSSGVDTLDVEFGYMYADSGNFPKASVSDILESLENQFGVRFDYDVQQRKVTARLLRDVFNYNTPIEVNGEVLSAVRVVEKITGVKVAYSAESDAKEQSDNLRDKKRDYDTTYDYIDYPSPDRMGPTGVAAASRTEINLTYAQLPLPLLVDNVCYIDQQTGNAYRIKVDSEATNIDELKPVRFEVGQYKGAEWGDCSKKYKDFVTEFTSHFEPLILSRVGYRMVPFCEEDMEHEWVPQQLEYPLGNTEGRLITGEESLLVTLHLIENYSPSNSEAGNSPLQSYDWGLAVGVMRGSGVFTPDTMNLYGSTYPYSGEHFSLKMRAYKQPSWAENPLCAEDVYDEQSGWTYVRHRGCADIFMSDMARFILERKKIKLSMRMPMAEIMYIRSHWTSVFRIGDLVGFIASMRYNLSCDRGVSDIELTFYAF